MMAESNVDFNNGTATIETDAEPAELTPPEHLFSDYVEIAYLGLVICAGLALNVGVLRRLLNERRRIQRSNKTMNGFLLLKLNLNVSDILILLIHATGKLGWLITYEWRGGDFLCRLFNLLSMFTLYLSSNIVICIALDRLLTVLRAKRMDLDQKKLNLVRLMISLAWIFSLGFSLPQVIVWTTYNPFKDSLGWIQCTDIWSINKYEQYLSGMSGNASGQNGTASSWMLRPIVQNSYELTHLFLVFYGPLIVLIFCYAVISTRLIRFAADNPCSNSMIMPNSSNDNNVAADGRPRSCSADRRFFKRASVKSFPAVKLYSPSGLRRKSQQAPMMQDIMEVSTRAEEPSDGVYQQQQQTSLQNMLLCAAQQHGVEDKLSQRTAELPSALRMNSARMSNNSLPAFAMRNPGSACEEDFPGKSILLAQHQPRSVTPQRPSVASASSRSSSSHDIRRARSATQQGVQRKIFVRIRDSFRESFGKRKCRGGGYGVEASLAFQSSTTSISEHCGEANRPQGGQHTALWELCPPLKWLAKHIWKRATAGREEAADLGGRPQQRHYSASSSAALPRSQSGHQSTATAHSLQRQQSARSSFSTAASVPNHRQAADGAGRPMLPLWRRHLRSRAFRATLLVILVHLLLWSPYNVYALMKHVNERLFERMNEKANVLKDLQFLITLINPFLYGFGGARASTRRRKC